jgi:hypothetical protein
MKASVDLPDPLDRQARHWAALRGRKLQDLVEERLRLVLETPRDSTSYPNLAELIATGTGRG